jgi:hypothetical protein
MDAFRATTLGAAVLLVAARPAGHALPPPIAIQSCAVEKFAYEPPADPGWFLYWLNPPNEYGLYTDGVTIRYVNATNKVASRVAFAVNYRGDLQRIIDAGTFSPGVTIEHTFGQLSGDAYVGGPQPNLCRVVAVRFEDGSVWTAPGQGAGI